MVRFPKDEMKAFCNRCGSQIAKGVKLRTMARGKCANCGKPYVVYQTGRHGGDYTKDNIDSLINTRARVEAVLRIRKVQHWSECLKPIGERDIDKVVRKGKLANLSKWWWFPYLSKKEYEEYLANKVKGEE